MKRLILFAGVVLTLTFPALSQERSPNVTQKEGFVVSRTWTNLALGVDNQGGSAIYSVPFGEYGNYIECTEPSGFSRKNYVTVDRFYSKQTPDLLARAKKLWLPSVENLFFFIDLPTWKRGKEIPGSVGLYKLKWEFTFGKTENRNQSQFASMLILREKRKATIEDRGSIQLNVDKPKPSDIDPADVPDPAPTPVPPAKMLPDPTKKGFSQTLAAVVDAPQADLAFLLLNGPDKPLAVSPLATASQGNTFLVSTPDGQEVMDNPPAKIDAKNATLKPGELKIWKVNIKKWFDDHKLTQPGFYSLTWTCQGQKSEPFNLYVPNPEEKARLDKEAAQNQ